MKKPLYLQLDFPINKKGTIAPAVKRYFNFLDGKVLDVNFGKERYKKTFHYGIFSNGIYESFSWSQNKQTKTLRIQLTLIDPNSTKELDLDT